MLPDLNKARIYTVVFAAFGLILIIFPSRIAGLTGIDTDTTFGFGMGLVGGALVTLFFTLRPVGSKPSSDDRSRLEARLPLLFAAGAAGSGVVLVGMIGNMIWPDQTWTWVVSVTGLVPLLLTSIPLINFSRAAMRDPALRDERRQDIDHKSYKAAFETIFMLCLIAGAWVVVSKRPFDSAAIFYVIAIAGVGRQMLYCALAEWRDQ